MRIATPIYTISSTTSTIYGTNVNGTVVLLSKHAHADHLTDGPDAGSLTFSFISSRPCGRSPCSPTSPSTKTPFSIHYTVPLTLLTLTVS